MTEVGNPFCADMTVDCCITQQCAFPKIDGSPTCVCFNKQLAGGDTGSWKPKLFDYEGDFSKQFWLYYFLCGGVACHGPGACTPAKGERPCFAVMGKRLCVKYQEQLTGPIQDGVLCSGVGTSLCFWEQVQFPPAPNNPKIACCGWKMAKHPSEAAAGCMKYGA